MKIRSCTISEKKQAKMKWEHKNTLSISELRAALGLCGVRPAHCPCSAVNTEHANTPVQCKGCRWAYTSGPPAMSSPLPAGCCDRRGEAVLAPRARGKDSLNPSDTLDQNLSRVGQMPSRRQPRRPMGWERHRSCRGWLLAERAALPRCRARTPSTLTRACPGQARPGPGSAPPALGAPGGGGAAPLRARPRCRRRPGLDAEA